MGKKLNGDAQVGTHAAIWGLLYVADGSRNWHDASSSFQVLKTFVPFKPVIPQLLISLRERAKEISELPRYDHCSIMIIVKT